MTNYDWLICYMGDILEICGTGKQGFPKLFYTRN